ncbi:MAG: geranylgeranylglyceryl/heptaprenylglyceryl phosphate synthase [Flavobacteriaceae bacterium]|nr:geranylgeranylglyceryl/heptaprenylglyceryl phosphate synthase [Flavobacteriaceae bacterium]
MQSIYQNIIITANSGKRMLAVLIDPEKIDVRQLPILFQKIHASITTHIFIGGSTDANGNTENVVTAVKAQTDLPVLLFPGDYSQITDKSDGILFLSLLSGRNPEYLIEQQIKSIPTLKNSGLEIIPTGYLLIDGGSQTAVERISETRPIAQADVELIVNTALAGQFSGKQLIYLEAGSGAIQAVGPEIISAVKEELKIPLIVGGGIRTKQQLENAYQAGADLVVIGTAFEENEDFFNELKI